MNSMTIAARNRIIRICAIVFACLSITSFTLAQFPWP